MVFVASSFWGILWVPMRMTESMGVSPLWVQFWFTSVPALLLAFVCARARAHTNASSSAGTLVNQNCTQSGETPMDSVIRMGTHKIPQNDEATKTMIEAVRWLCCLERKSIINWSRHLLPHS